MAETIQRYNHTRQVLLHYGVENQSGNFYMELLNDSATFDATDTAKTDVDNAGAYEVSGNGWDVGGEAITVTVSVVNTDEAKWDAADLSITASGGNIGPAYKALVYLNVDNADTDYPPLWFITFDGSETAVSGNPFAVTFDSNGIEVFGDCT
jgi:hypothetical protein